MHVYTKIVLDMRTPLADGRFAIVSSEGYEYAGPVAEAKKGREQVDQAASGANALGQKASGIADTALGVSSQYGGLQKKYRAAGDAGASTYFGAPGANGLNKFTNSQYQSTLRQNDQNAKDDIGVGERMLAQRGWASSPGQLSSLINTTNRNRDTLDTEAYNTGLQRQLGLGLEGINYNVGQQQLYDPLRGIGAATGAIGAGSGAFGTGASAGAARSQMGSTLGDIGAGLSGIGSFFI